MATAILIGGLLLTLLVAYIMRRPEWRLAALLFGLLAIPGNVDNLMPQMALDPHPIRDSTAPVVSVVDLLIAWAAILTLRDGRFSGWPSALRSAIALAIAFAVVAGLITIINLVEGAPLPATVRGVFLVARIPALLAVVYALRDTIGDGTRIAIAVTLGLVSLIANGLFTSTMLETTRFTAATFGRNGAALALVISALVTAGLGIELVRRGPSRRQWVPAALCFALAAAGLFAAIATGTRMSLLVAVPAIVGALLMNRSWWHRRGFGAVAVLLLGVLAIGLAGALWTAEGGRAISVVTDPGETVDIITDPQGEPDYSSVRTRTDWWGQAIAMARAEPITGVGPFQWNVRRYSMDPDALPIVADPHSTYIQLAAEYGIPTLTLYVIGLAAVVALVLLTGWRSSSPARSSAVATALVAGALMAPVTELTNSHLFNVRLGAITWLLLGVALILTWIPRLAETAAPAKLRAGVAAERHDRASNAAHGA